LIRPVRIAPRALAHARRIDRWWRANRLHAPTLFEDELTAAIDRVEMAAESGRSYSRGSVPGVRRILLPRTRYHLYYRVAEDAVEVLAIWHAERGRGPSLG
jgi:plasmid stabilization system protein ParE